MRFRSVAAGALAVLACASVAAARSTQDGGSGTYSGSGATFAFDVTNPGTTAWKYFVVLPPGGNSFTGGQITNGPTGPCIVGNFVAGPGELECGPLSPPVTPDGRHILFMGTTSAPVPCGVPFPFDVNSTGTPPYTLVGNLIFSGTCPTVPPPPPTPAPRPAPRRANFLLAIGDFNADGSPDLAVTTFGPGVIGALQQLGVFGVRLPAAANATPRYLLPVRLAVKKAGRYRIPLRATTAGKAVIQRTGKLSVRVRVTFRAPSGASSSKTTTVTFHRKR